MDARINLWLFNTKIAILSAVFMSAVFGCSSARNYSTVSDTQKGSISLPFSGHKVSIDKIEELLQHSDINRVIDIIRHKFGLPVAIIKYPSLGN